MARAAPSEPDGAVAPRRGVVTPPELRGDWPRAAGARADPAPGRGASDPAAGPECAPGLGGLCSGVPAPPRLGPVLRLGTRDPPAGARAAPALPRPRKLPALAGRGAGRC